MIDKIKKIINIEFQNPYPKDIFTWTNPEKITLSRGRFNEFIHSIVEMTKKDIMKLIEENLTTSAINNNFTIRKSSSKSCRHRVEVQAGSHFYCKDCGKHLGTQVGKTS